MDYNRASTSLAADNQWACDLFISVQSYSTTSISSVEKGKSTELIQLKTIETFFPIHAFGQNIGKFVRYWNGLSVYMFMVNIEVCHFVYITLNCKQVGCFIYYTCT
jgi:hypothetical protein